MTHDAVKYGKAPKFSDTRNLCCNLTKIQTKRPQSQNSIHGIANSEDPDQTAPLGTVCPDRSV